MSILAAGHQSLLGVSVSGDHDNAVALLAALTDYYTFDDMVGSELSANDWSNQNNGTQVYTYSASALGKRAVGQQPNVAPSISGLATGDKLCFWFWTDFPASTSTRQTLVGLGDSTGLSTSPRLVVAMNTNGGNTIFMKVFDSPSQVNSASTPTTPSGRYFCCLNWDGTAKSAELWVDGALIDTLILTTAPPASTLDALAWFENTGLSTFSNIPCSLDELGLAHGINLTAGMVSYLYNSGAGKSYAEVLADAA